MKATVLNTVTNATKVVELNEVVSNVSDLKHFLNLQEDDRLFESVTHTNLEHDNQILPVLPQSKQNKGYVFFVSPAQNKVKNGTYTRKECYEIIRENNLGERVKEEFGRNFTQVATDALNNIISIYGREGASPYVEVTPAPIEDVDADKITTEKELISTLANLLFDVFNAEPQLNVEETKAKILEGIERVFPNPYSVQDLSNMR